MSTHSPSKGIVAEIRLIVRRARQVWRLVPMRHKMGLAFAGAIMAAVSLCNTALPLLLGKLVDAVKPTGADTPKAGGYLIAIEILGLIGGA